MNPWTILGEVLGWGLLSLTAFVLLLLIAGIIIAPFKRGKRTPATTPVFKGKRDY